MRKIILISFFPFSSQKQFKLLCIQQNYIKIYYLTLIQYIKNYNIILSSNYHHIYTTAGTRYRNCLTKEFPDPCHLSVLLHLWSSVLLQCWYIVVQRGYAGSQIYKLIKTVSRLLNEIFDDRSHVYPTQGDFGKKKKRHLSLTELYLPTRLL